MANVFNTFSFNKWADTKKEEEIDKESRKRRHQQIKRLKEKLRKERELREQGLGGDGDIDLEALIEALQSGEAINTEKNPFANWSNGHYVPGTGAGTGEAGQAGKGGGRHDDDSQWENGATNDLDDDYILDEIRRYKTAHGGTIKGAAEERDRSASSVPRVASAARDSPLPGPVGTQPATPQINRFAWQYNRRVAELMVAGRHSEPSSRSSSRSPSARPPSNRPSSNRAPPTRTHSADRFRFNRHVTNGQQY